jgi:DNA repair protein RadC
MAKSNPTIARAQERRIINQAIAILDRQVRESRTRYQITGTSSARDYLKVRLGALDHEVFVVLFLNTQHRVIAIEELFRGTLTQTSVYPREVVKAALRHNAAAVILAHNHPSGSPAFSDADKRLQTQLADTLRLVDVTVLDCLVVAGSEVASSAEQEQLIALAEDQARRGAQRERRERASAAMKAAWARRKAARAAGSVHADDCRLAAR